MTKLEQMLVTLCPSGVKHRSLGELGSFYGGLSGKSKSDFTDGNAKFITYLNVYSNPALRIDVSDQVKIGKNEKQNCVHLGDVLFTGSSETPNECGMSSVLNQETSELLFLNSFCFGFRFTNVGLLLPDFSKHLFRSERIRRQIGQTASGVTRFNVSKRKMEKVIIPLPPLPVQHEIVRILDTFTELTSELTTELTAELTARKKQCEYYRDKLLTFDMNVPFTTLGDLIISLNTGLNPRQFFQLNTDDARNYYVTIRELLNNKIVVSDKTDRINDEALKLCNNRSNLEIGDVLFSGTGTIGETAMIEKSPMNWNIKEGVYTLKPKQDLIVPRFLMYMLRSPQVKKAYMQKAFGGTVKSVSMSEMRKLMISIPPLEEQKRIVALLDRFDTLCNGLSSGLPAEIEARRKQYEYYRDNLLTFKVKPV